jgi:serine protease Do
MEPRTKRFIVPTAAAAAVALTFAAGQHAKDAPAIGAAQAAPAQTAPSPRAQLPLPDFASLVEQYGPAVVNISVTKTATAGMPGMEMPEFDEDGPMGEFFRRFGIPAPRGGQPGQGPGPMPQPAQGVGSGFIVSTDGTILTNAHVVDGATEVLVKLADKRELKAKVIGSDRKSDVAVIKVDAKDLPTVRIGDASKVRVGEWVAAIGSPFGLENTVTAGIVSAKSRNVGDERIVPFIQTDVAVNPGNSGGPLFNLAGEVVGINSMIFSRSGGYMGVSFAIPIDVAMQVKDDLVKHGKVTRGRIGVVVQPVTAPLAESFGLAKAQGALVANVEPSGPAAKAGLKPGDVILSYNGKAVAESSDLPTLVAATKPGEPATVQIWRDGKETDLKLTVGEMPGDKTTVAANVAEPQGKLGVAVRPLAADEAKKLGAEGGVVVERAGGAAAKAGVRPGDVILGVNGKTVKSPEDLKSAIDGAGKNAALLVQRGEGRLYVPVQIG